MRHTQAGSKFLACTRAALCCAGGCARACAWGACVFHAVASWVVEHFMFVPACGVVWCGVHRLPVVVSAASRPGLAALLGRILEHLKRILQPQPAQQQHLQQQHGVPAWLGAGGEPAAKKQRTAEAAAGAAAADTHAEVLDALLLAYAAACGSLPAATDGSWDWRVEFMGTLQELPLLHGPLLRRLMGSLCGSAWPSEVSPQQVREGRVAASDGTRQLPCSVCVATKKQPKDCLLCRASVCCPCWP